MTAVLRYFGLGAMTLLLAACSTPQGPSSPVAVGETPAESPQTDISQKPLQVPSLDQLPETPVRPLASQFQSVQWGALPGWNNDELD